MSARRATESEGLKSLSAPVRGPVETQLEGLKEQLLQPILERVSNSELVKEILWAANEAAALAWCTICPVLVLPLLLEEKVRAAFAKWEKQQRVRNDLFKPQTNASFDLISLPAAA